MSQTLITTNEAKEIDLDELLKKLSTSKTGLSNSEAKKRVQQFGLNEIAEKKVNPLMKFLSNFWGPIPWMIEIAVILSGIIGHWQEFFIILFLLLINGIIRFWEEHQADNAIEALKQRLALKAKVLRDNHWLELPARELVPGDIIRVRLGDIVPADIKLIDGDYLLVDQSALTGESLPVEKHLFDVAFSGSIIKQGEMNALVVSTGMNTYFGKTTKLVEEATKHSHFQKAIIKIGDFLITLDLLLVTFIFLVAIFRNESILETLQFVLVLTVASIPAALPAVLSVTMAIGAMVLAKKGAIVTKLSSIEELAGVDVLCSDKTGTITKNELSIAAVEPLENFTATDVFLIGTLASKEEDQDPIDNTIISKAKTLEPVIKTLDSYKVTEFTPFDPVIKHTEATILDADGTSFKVAKGAPQVILSLVSNREKIKAKVNEFVNVSARKGYRSLGVARTLDNEENWQFVGIIALFDPPREDSAETVTRAENMGLQVKMITGDHLAIAKEIAGKVNLGSSIIRFSTFKSKGDMGEPHYMDKIDGFAQVLPEDKYQIVDYFQKNGHIVAMTGDGVNDAPALKKADVGIAVANATDAARSAADIVLTRPGLSEIIDSTQESRKIFQRMTNYSLYRVTETIRIVIFITLAIIAFNFYPITPLMIVLLAILNDAPIMTIAFDNVKYRDEPERWHMATLLGISTFLGVIGVMASFGMLYIGQVVLQLNPDILQSLIYLKLSVAGHLTLFVARTKGPFWSIKPSKPLLLAVISTQFIATIITVYGILLPAMGWGLALLVWGYALIAFIITDYLKVRFYKVCERNGVKYNNYKAE
ncbi:MAG: plasma-membrane proton-efflux P-type ATPase [Candidatus Thorarchaeota archaeon]